MTKIIGYGICGPGEAHRYMQETLNCFRRLCDVTIILCNNVGVDERILLNSFDIKTVHDFREWGKFQWQIKQDFIQGTIARIAENGDMLVCLDMDEVLDEELTREWLLEAPCDAYKVFIVDLWNDTDHYKPESCFWNTRLWRWNGETAWERKPLHCGLSPLWTRRYNRYAPFFLWHYGLMKKEDRERKYYRYMKYDPHAIHLDPVYYNMLQSDTAKLLDLAILRADMAKQVPSLSQTKPRTVMAPQKKRFAYIKNPHGMVVDIPERHLAQTLARKGFEFIGWADEQDKEMEALFADTETDETMADEPALNEAGGSYQRSTVSEKREVEDLNRRDDEKFFPPKQVIEGEKPAPEPQKEVKKRLVKRSIHKKK